jgi:hypothetical protein
MVIEYSGLLADYNVLQTHAERALVPISSSSCGIDSIAIAHLNNGLGTIIRLPGEIIGPGAKMMPTYYETQRPTKCVSGDTEADRMDFEIRQLAAKSRSCSLVWNLQNLLGPNYGFQTLPRSCLEQIGAER